MQSHRAKEIWDVERFLANVWKLIHGWGKSALLSLSKLRITMPLVTRLYWRWIVSSFSSSHLFPNCKLGLNPLASTYIQELKLRTNPTVDGLNLALKKSHAVQGGVTLGRMQTRDVNLSFLPFCPYPSRTAWWTLASWDTWWIKRQEIRKQKLSGTISRRNSLGYILVLLSTHPRLKDDSVLHL